MSGSLRVFSIFILVAICCSYLGCAMHSQTMKTGAGENIAVRNLINDQDFKNDHLVKVALDRSKNSGFYGLQATYMNDVAYNAFVNKNDFCEDSKIVLAFFNFSDKDGMILPGKKMWSATMEKTMESKTGNWAYSSTDYQTLKPKFPDPVNTCYVGCHKAKESNDYVFLEHPRK